MGNEITKSFLNETPVAYVGKYLRHLCNDSSVTEYFLYSRSQPSSEIGGKELLPVSELFHMHSSLYNSLEFSVYTTDPFYVSGSCL